MGIQGSVRPRGDEFEESNSDFCRVCLDVPYCIFAGTLEDSDDEEDLGPVPEEFGEVCERVGLASEEDFVKVLKDPYALSHESLAISGLVSRLCQGEGERNGTQTGPWGTEGIA